MQYLIGLASPTLEGIAFSAALTPVGARSARTGLQRYAWAVQAPSCSFNLSSAGRSMMASVPRNRPPMYSRTVAGASRPGCGPFRFDREISPFPLATSSRLPSGVTRTDVGYQPTGMNPSERLLPGTPTSNTARLLLSALATNSVFSSGDRARLLGVEPGGRPGCRDAVNVSSVLPVPVSNTVTLFRAALATYRIRPDAANTISQGCACVGQRAVTWFAFRSTTATAACAHRLT